eukprot:GGOE01014212.1.p1 GENE.GGOE01014212.1~~GGOE01014212.1.p1  ORF type:complete len:262 (-),score=49.53 GGOE01014212.1:244-1002(-)
MPTSKALHRVVLLFGAPGAGKGTYATALRRTLGFAQIAMGDALREEVRRGTAIGKAVQKHTEGGTLAPDNLIAEVLGDRLRAYAEQPNSPFLVLEGFPRTKVQLLMLEDLLGSTLEVDGGHQKTGTNVALVLELMLREDLLLRKSAGRLVCQGCGENYNSVEIVQPDQGVYMPAILPAKSGVCDFCGGELHQRPDDQPEIVRQRLTEYHTMAQPLLSYYQDRSVLRQVDVNAGATRCTGRIVEVVKAGLGLP